MTVSETNGHCVRVRCSSSSDPPAVQGYNCLTHHYSTCEQSAGKFPSFVLGRISIGQHFLICTIRFSSNNLFRGDTHTRTYGKFKKKKNNYGLIKTLVRIWKEVTNFKFWNYKEILVFFNFPFFKYPFVKLSYIYFFTSLLVTKYSRILSVPNYYTHLNK